MSRPLVMKILILIALVAVLLVGVQMFRGNAATLPATGGD